MEGRETEALRGEDKKTQSAQLMAPANRSIADRRLAENPDKQTVGANKKAGGSGQWSPRSSKPKAEGFRNLGEILGRKEMVEQAGLEPATKGL